MANIPERQQIVPEDFKKDDQETAAQIADPFNTYVEQLNEILNQNLTFSDNFRGQVKTLDIIAGQPISFKYAKTAKPIGLWIMNYSNLTDPTEVLTVAVQIQWSFDGQGNISIDNVTGLTATETYRLTFIAISG
jgi:hypothetical protein